LDLYFNPQSTIRNPQSKGISIRNQQSAIRNPK